MIKQYNRVTVKAKYEEKTFELFNPVAIPPCQFEFSVVAGPPSKLKVEQPDTVRVGKECFFDLHLKDKKGNPIEASDETVTIEAKVTKGISTKIAFPLGNTFSLSSTIRLPVCFSGNIGVIAIEFIVNLNGGSSILASTMMELVAGDPKKITIVGLEAVMNNSEHEYIIAVIDENNNIVPEGQGTLNEKLFSLRKGEARVKHKFSVKDLSESTTETLVCKLGGLTERKAVIVEPDLSPKFIQLVSHPELELNSIRADAGEQVPISIILLNELETPAIVGENSVIGVSWSRTKTKLRSGQQKEIDLPSFTNERVGCYKENISVNGIAKEIQFRVEPGPPTVVLFETELQNIYDCGKRLHLPLKFKDRFDNVFNHVDGEIEVNAVSPEVIHYVT